MAVQATRYEKCTIYINNNMYIVHFSYIVACTAMAHAMSHVPTNLTIGILVYVGVFMHECWYLKIVYMLLLWLTVYTRGVISHYNFFLLYVK